MEIKKLKFISKVKDLKEYMERVQEPKYVEEEEIAIIKTITLSIKEFKKFISDFFEAQDFLINTCDWLEQEKVFTAVRVTDGATKIVVYTYGNKYARYVAVEEEPKIEIKTLSFASKPSDIVEAKNTKYKERSTVAIVKTIILSKKEFLAFINDFFHEWSFLKETCIELEDGIFTAVRITDGITKIVVDTQGFNYARYVALE